MNKNTILFAVCVVIVLILICLKCVSADGGAMNHEGYRSRLRTISGPKQNLDAYHRGYMNDDPPAQQHKGFFWPEGQYMGIAPSWNGTNYRDLAREHCKNSNDPNCGKITERQFFNTMHGS